MPVRFLSDAELVRLSGWPDEIADGDLITYFTLTSDDFGWLTSNVRVENRLGVALQLFALPWPGWIPDDLTACPSTAVDRFAAQLGLAVDDVARLLAAYGGSEGRTRRDHRALVLDRLGWRARRPGIASNSTRSFSLGRWNTTRPVCCFSWPAIGCATNGSSARRWTPCPDASRLPATVHAPRRTTGWIRCSRRRARAD